MADQRRRSGGGGEEDWPARVDVDGGELEAAAAAGGSVLSGEYQAQEMSTMVSALSWIEDETDELLGILMGDSQQHIFKLKILCE
uniref:Uncharacterized protein n=1 Tax=Oryza brachyantha TaxID=4533 RepID=J3M7J4_ORYBR